MWVKIREEKLRTKNFGKAEEEMLVIMEKMLAKTRAQMFVRHRENIGQNTRGNVGKTRMEMLIRHEKILVNTPGEMFARLIENTGQDTRGNACKTRK